jgi:hypothetical protein
MATWKITGEYMETCNCAFLCPCITSNMVDLPTEGDCKAALALRIDKGHKDGVLLDGLSFIVMMHAPGAMGAGNIDVGLIIDERANDAQAAAIRAIASGSVGGPMAALGPLIRKIAGVERQPIEFDVNGLHRTVRAGNLLEQSCEGVGSASAPGHAIVVDNTAHPVSARLSLAKATRSLFNVFGIKWNDSSGTRNGHFAPFAWAG